MLKGQMIEVEDGTTAVLSFNYSDRLMSHLNNAPSEPHIETKVNIAVMQNGLEVGRVEAATWCSPLDEFDEEEGRVLAIKRAFKKDTRHVLTKKMRSVIASYLIIPHAQLQKIVPRKQRSSHSK